MEQSIQVLSSQLINKIAAGEVVERPASIVKELIENSLDAGAKHIKVNIKEGGNEQIIVWDNGEGIKKEDLLLALKRHTTSKIRQISDLSRINTYGFRGEALSSISAVSRLKLKTRYHESTIAYQIFINDPQSESQFEVTARSIGTTIEITNLFFNVPARAKFLKSASTEYRYVLNIVIQFALAHPQVKFELKHNDRQVFNLISNNGKDSYLGRWLELLKVEDSDLVHLFYDGESSKISGFVLQPAILSSKARFEYIFVNNRPVMDKSLRQAVKQGYEGFIPDFKRPSYVIMLTVNPEIVDVNVHPRKTEVRFINPFRIFKAVQESVQTALKKSYQSNSGIYKGKINSLSEKQSFKYKPVKSVTWNGKKGTLNELESTSNKSHLLINDSGIDQKFDMSNLTKVKQNTNTNLKLLEKTLFKISREEILAVFQIMRKYLVVDLGGKIWIVDQHAAAERIRFEELLKRYQEKSITQLMAVPLEIVLSINELEIVKQYLSLIKRLGFKAVIQNDKLIILGIPVLFVKSKNLTLLLKDLISEISINAKNLTNNEMNQIDNIAINKTLRNILATLACHSSIRAQERVPVAEAQKLIKKLIVCDQPFTCPHGRPTIWVLNKDEIDGHFDRKY